MPESEEGKIPKKQIFSAPMRFVRTDQGLPGQIKAKSRSVIPGHRDRQLGPFRSYSPTTSSIAVILAAPVGISMDWLGEIFDVKSAFLSGLELQRKIHVRAPKEGLPGPDTTKVISPSQLMRVLKCAYGLTEAPRLWYLRAKQLLESIGFVELTCAKAVFTLRSGTGKLVTILVLHVDDALIFRDRSDPMSKKAREQMD